MRKLYEDLGSVLALQQRFEEAVPLLEKAVRLEPSWPWPIKSLAKRCLLLVVAKKLTSNSKNFLTKIQNQGSLHLAQTISRQAEKMKQ